VIPRTSEDNGVAPNAAAWRAILHRDRHLDGQFVYVALTTNIYCRPSCAARHPQRCEVLVFPTADYADREGYTACRRCRPASGSLAGAEKSVKAALEYVATHLDHPVTLRTLSQVAGLSPNHLQKTFKRVVGLSPKTFRDFRRLARLKEHLRRADSVASAGYAAGYGSIRSLYEKAYKALGMTPAEYRKGGPRERVEYATSAVTLGRVLVARTKLGVCGVLVRNDDDNALLAALTRELPRSILAKETSIPASWRTAIHRCDQEDPLLSTLGIRLRRDVFQARLWHALLQLGTRHPRTRDF
jgi:AraC family transcriptional regulator, regulatory protein of adaptative response / methylated-DNA-[protein]-cysteine methyltransferase